MSILVKTILNPFMSADTLLVCFNCHIMSWSCSFGYIDLSKTTTAIEVLMVLSHNAGFQIRIGHRSFSDFCNENLNFK